MTRSISLAILMALAMDLGYSQERNKPLAFEVAAVTPCKAGTPEPPGEHAGMVQFTSPGGRFRAAAASLNSLMEWAYGIQPFQHSGGPNWMDNDRYDIIAKAGSNATDDEMKQMTQTLLAERFHLKFHTDQKTLPVYVISLGKNAPSLFPPKEGEAHSLQVIPKSSPEQKVLTYHVVATRFSLKQLTDVFARQLGSVIQNETGMNGDYDFTLDLTPDDAHPNALDPSILMAAMREELGLTLKTSKAPVDIFVIDNIEKVTGGN
jgi:uncharacterized protein (TIGR03435 family)